MSRNSLTITDNRTGETYEVPIQDETINAIDLRKIKVQADEFGMMTYDPASPTQLRARAGLLISTAIKASWNTGAIPSSSWPNIATFWKWPI